MEKKLVFAALVIGLVICGCTSAPQVTFESIVPDSTPSNYEGTWIHPNVNSENARIVFSGNSFSYLWNSGIINGRFINDGRRIQFLTADGRNWSTTHTLNTDELRLEQGKGGWHWYGTFQKIDTNQNVGLNGSWKHPNPQAQGATYIFNGNQFTYSRNNGFNTAGDFDFTGNKLTIRVSGQIVREYQCYFQKNGTQIYLSGISGDGNNYYQGLFEKQ